MDKAAFLAALQRNIGMLDDNEQKDIIDEYAQHIDMKVSQGMTEEEAIEDFGEFQDFVREVLNAYHVKAPFDQPDMGEKHSASEAANAGEPGTAAAFKDAFGKLAASTADTVGKAADQLKASAAAHSAQKAAAGTTAQDAPCDPNSLFCKAKAIFWTALRWAWNLFILFCALCAFGAGLGCLCCLGACVVVTILGYPAIGASLMSLGASAALFAAAYLLCKLIARKHNTKGCSRKQAPENLPKDNAFQAPAEQEGITQASGTAKRAKEDRAAPPQMPQFPPSHFDTIPFEKVGGGKNE